MKICEYEISRKINYKKFINDGKTYFLSDYPYLDVVLNDTCNKKCNFCIGNLMEKKDCCDINLHKEKIDYAIKRLGIKEILILGGEVTIKPMDNILFSLLSYIRKYLLTKKINKICLTTNGYRFKEDKNYLELLLKNKTITHINLSLMNFNEKIKIDDLKRIYEIINKYKVHLRINNNVWKGNNDSLESIVNFYNQVSPYCDSIKFSPLLKTDSFSVVNKVNNWVKQNILSDEDYTNLWNKVEKNYNYPILRNKETFGFVEYSMILMKKPIIFNYNQYGKLREKIIKENKINNIKLLSNSKLSLSWNKNETEYLIK